MVDFSNLKISKVLNQLYKQSFRVELGCAHLQGPILYSAKFTKPHSMNEIKLPLRIHGRLMTVGKYYDPDLRGDIYLTSQSLMDAVSRWQGIAGYDSHAVNEAVCQGKHASVRGVVAKMVKAVFNKKENAIDFEADVYDADIAFKIQHGLIRFVSAGFKHEISPMINDPTGFEVSNIQPLEWSFVLSPRDPNAIIEPMGVSK